MGRVAVDRTQSRGELSATARTTETRVPIAGLLLSNTSPTTPLSLIVAEGNAVRRCTDKLMARNFA
jgi:hypothetical protein